MNITEIILALLVAAYPGVRNDGLKQLANSLSLAVSTEEEAKEVVGKLTADNVNKFIADWRRDADAEIEKANKTREENLRKKYDFVEKSTEPPTPPTPPAGPSQPSTFTPEQMQEMITKAVTTATGPLQEQINSITGSATSAARREQIESLFTEEIPEVYKDTILDSFDNRSFDNEEAFNQYLTKTKDNVAALKQEIADKGLGGIEEPVFGKPNKDGVSLAAADYIKERQAEEEGKAPASGKELNV